MISYDDEEKKGKNYYEAANYDFRVNRLIRVVVQIHGSSFTGVTVSVAFRTQCKHKIRCAMCNIFRNNNNNY